MSDRLAASHAVARGARSFRYAALGLMALGGAPAVAEEAAPADDGAPVLLDTLSVGGDPDRASASAGTKTSRPVVETPQSISVIPVERALEQGAQSLQDALRYTAGIRTDSYGVDARGDWGFIRGIDPYEYLDGMRRYVGYYNTTRPEIFGMERVEVLRGAASVLYGQAPLGGLISLVSKRPVFATTGQIGVHYGSFARKQIEADASAVLDAKGTLAARLVGVWRDSDTQVDHVGDDRLMASPSLTWRPTADTELTLIGLLQEDDSGSTAQFLPHSGRILPNPNGPIPSSRFLGEPSFEQYDTAQQALTMQVSHRFNDAVTFRQTLRRSWSGARYQSHYPDVYSNPADPFIDADHRVLNRYVYIDKVRTRALTSDTQLDVKFKTGPFTHELLLGADFARFRQTGRIGFGLSTPIDVFAPVYGSYIAPPLSPDPKQSFYQFGLYMQDIIGIGEKVDLLVGLRHDKTGNQVEGTADQKDSATTKRFAIIGKTLALGFSPYFTYAESFLPVAGADFFNTPFKPQQGRMYEVGAKWQPEPGSPVLVTLAWFDMTDKNRLVADPANPFNQLQSGEVKSRGVELEATAYLPQGYEIVASYSYTRAAQDGLQLESVPKHVAALWGSRYIHFDNGMALQLGAGVRYAGASWDATNTLETPSVTLVDALLAFEMDKWRFAINGTNLADEDFDSTCLARGDCFVGARRTIAGSVSWRF